MISFEVLNLRSSRFYVNTHGRVKKYFNALIMWAVITQLAALVATLLGAFATLRKSKISPDLLCNTTLSRLQGKLCRSIWAVITQLAALVGAY